MGTGTALALARCRVPVAGRVRQAGVVQTFLPYPDFVDALAVLDSPRLGKQRVETLQILRALVFPEYGWRNHPAVRMWRGRLPALVLYGLTSVAQWERRGFADTTAGQIAEFAPNVVGSTQADLAAAGLLPGWLGDDRLHRSHQSKLLSKNPEHYGRFFLDVPADLDYFWPDPDEVLPGDPMQGGPSLWVIRPASPHALGRFLQEGMIVQILLDVAGWIILIQFILSVLISFNVVNTHNDFVRGLWNALTVVTEPVYRPIRRILPNMGGLDLSPIVVFVIIFFLQQLIANFAVTGRLI